MDRTGEPSAQQVAILGAGTMGSELAALMACAGFQVMVWNWRETGCLERIRQLLAREIRAKTFSAQSEEPVLSRITVTSHMQDLAASQHVLEAVVEDLEVKREVLKDVESVCRSAELIGSLSSALSPSAISEHLRDPSRFIGLHFLNPPTRILLVEVLRSPWTSEDTLQRATRLVRDLGRTPLIMGDLPGGIVNRLLFGMIGEAFRLLETAGMSPEKIDEAMRVGAGHPRGPLALADHIGLDVCLAVLRNLYRATRQDQYLPSHQLTRRVEAGKLGRKVGEGVYTYSRARQGSCDHAAHASCG